jgi:crotonobetainyl-CoA:carnitine CoA-transferase CaiB-like acyl-CoA transferase
MAPRGDKVTGMPPKPPPTAPHLHPGPLSGLSVIDISSVIAGPFSAGLLADFGADVIKVELPGVGDALRALAPHKDSVPLWWKVTNRNKRGVTLDLHLPEGREALGRLIERADVLVENFRPGTLDRWGIDTAWLHGLNPRLTILRLTGFGQTGPKRDEPGFARVFEAMSGFTHLCGEAERDPLHLGYPISDAVGGLFGALGVLAALYKCKADPASGGQEIDCSVTEAMLRVMEFSAIEYDQLGAVRGRSGNTSQYAAPGNIYRTADGHCASIAASTQSIFERLCRALGLVCAEPATGRAPHRTRRDRGCRDRRDDARRAESAPAYPRGRLLAHQRHRRRVRRCAPGGARGHHLHRRRRAGAGAHAERGAAVQRHAGQGAASRAVAGAGQ